MKLKTGGFSVKSKRIISGSDLTQYWILIATWIVVSMFFWTWWVQPQNIGNPYLFALMSIALLYEMTVLPSFYSFFLYHMRRPITVPVEKAREVGKIRKVAMITLTVPGSESIEIVKRQLIAMRQVRYPHDSWILVDKVHSPEIEKIATSLGVKYFSRHDGEKWGSDRVNYWNQAVPPFKAKTKAGNVNAWIDAFGSNYSHFTQLDIDHIPRKSYLHKVLGYFLDEKVAWVQAPSVYGNLEEWTARGSAEQELVLQGPLQMGFYGFSKTPFIIGSHCTYDMQAIKDIGGFQPTRAEDHLDTVFLAAAGKEGVFLPEAIAIGDGPENFETYMAQQFAWAFSMIQVLFNYTPRCIKNYTKRQAVQFLFVQTWYTLWSTCMLALFIIPLIALVTNTPIAHVNFWEFTQRSLLVSTTALVIWYWSHRWHFPKKVELTWNGMILHVARWPIVLSAFIQVLLKVQKPYMITVKGLHNGANRPFNISVHMPYFILIASSIMACWYYLAMIKHSAVQGYLLFALEGGVVILFVYLTALFKDLHILKSEGITLLERVLLRLQPVLVLVIIVIMLVTTSAQSAPQIGQAVFYSDDGITEDAPTPIFNPVVKSNSIEIPTALLNPYVSSDEE